MYKSIYKIIPNYSNPSPNLYTLLYKNCIIFPNILSKSCKIS